MHFFMCWLQYMSFKASCTSMYNPNYHSTKLDTYLSSLSIYFLWTFCTFKTLHILKNSYKWTRPMQEHITDHITFIQLSTRTLHINNRLLTWQRIWHWGRQARCSASAAAQWEYLRPLDPAAPHFTRLSTSRLVLIIVVIIKFFKINRYSKV